MRFIIILLAATLPFSCLGQMKNLEVEANHSTVGFEISISGFSIVSGKFGDYTISIDWDAQNLSDSKIKAVIQASSMNTGIPDRDQHLQSEDFFEVEKYPTIRFESNKIQFAGQDSYIASGTLNMHGVTKEIDLPFTITKIDGNTIGFKCRTQINRQDFKVGSTFQHDSMPDFLSDLIDVRINFWTKKRKAKK